MAIQYRYRRGGKSRAKTRTPKYQTRRAGAFGMLRGTRNVARVRSVARRYGRGTISRSLNPFPNTKLVRHKYVDTVSIPAGGGTGLPVVYQFRTNSVYDPDYIQTLGGHQPLFHDEMAAQYKYYTVLHSKIMVTTGVTNNQDLNILLWVDDDTTVPTNPNDALEQHSSRNATVKISQRTRPLVKVASWNCARWNKTTKAAILGDDMHKVARNTNPDNTITKYFTYYVAPLSSGTTITSFPVKVELVYYTLWREPVDHVGS